MKVEAPHPRAIKSWKRTHRAPWSSDVKCDSCGFPLAGWRYTRIVYAQEKVTRGKTISITLFVERICDEIGCAQ